MCGDPSRYCPGNSSHPLNVPLGYYSTGGNESTRYDITIAPAGYFAVKGLVYPCQAGYYGAIAGLSSPTCSGLCTIPGYYCPSKLPFLIFFFFPFTYFIAASISPFMHYCGGDDYYCPPGTVAPIKVHTGYYTVDYQYDACPPGKWRNFTIPRHYFAYELNYSAVETINLFPECQPCPIGTYKSVAGDGFDLCLPCNTRDSTSSPSRIICDCTRVYEPGYVAYFNISNGKCRKLDVNLLPTLNDEAWAQNISLTRSRQYPCEAGYFCREGLRFICPAGYFGSINQETNPFCSGICHEGYYCPLGSTSPFMKACGAANLICPTGSPYPILVPEGYYTNEDAREDLRSEKFICPPGYYCPGDGRRYKCPPGTYATEEGVSSNQCMGPCDKGKSQFVRFCCKNLISCFLFTPSRLLLFKWI